MHTSQISVKRREGTGEVFGGNTAEGVHRHHTSLQECGISLNRILHFRVEFCCDAFLHRPRVCPQANEYSLPSLNTGLEDVKPSLSTSASSDLASSVSQSYSVVTGTIQLTPHRALKE